MSGIILVADLHIGNRTAFGQYSAQNDFPGCNSRAINIFNYLRNIGKYAKQNNCEAIIVAGDIFHTRGTIEVPIYNATYDIFAELNEIAKLYVMPGNHDMVSIDSMYSERGFNSLYSYNKLCSIIHTPTLVELDNFIVSVIPFNIKIAPVVEAAKRLLKQSNKCSISVFHQSFNGAVFGPHQFKMPHELDTNSINGYDLNFSGHFHMHQTIKNKLTYVGAPLHHDLGERNYIPGFIHVLPDGTWKHIENTTSPRFASIEAKSFSDIEQLDGNNYNIVYWDTSNGNFEEVMDKVKTLNSVIQLRSEATKRISRSNISTTDPAEQMITKYVEAKKGALDKALVEQGKNLYKGK